MELHQVRYFLAVHETRNFTRAAERCNVSQPALTSAIKKLESELNGPLFYRDRGGAKLTNLGEMVLPRFRRLCDESDSILEVADNHRLLRNVPLRMGVLCTIGPTRLAGYLERFRQRAPAVELEIRVLPHEQLMHDLEDATIEVIITNADVVSQPWAVVKHLYRESYVVVLPHDHPLRSSSAIGLYDIAGEPYIDRLACELREMVVAAFDARGLDLYAIYRTENEAWIECLVRAGVGLALMPEHSVVSADATRRALVNPAVARTISMVRSADHPSSPAAKLLWETLVEA
ncbi:MAG: LysR family transcriptional regulator [Myxococcales bacterium]|nr:LysR family transcriptional regulator [Myxococcales bacterium]